MRLIQVFVRRNKVGRKMEKGELNEKEYIKKPLNAALNFNEMLSVTMP